jgi:arsenate reductase
MAKSAPMEFSDKEIVIFYKPDIKKDNNTYVLASQITSHIRDIDVLKEKLTSTQLKKVVDMLGLPIEDLIERDSDIYKSMYHDKAFDEAGWLSVLVQNPDLLRTPIVFKGKKGILIETPSNVLSLDDEKNIKEGRRDL